MKKKNSAISYVRAQAGSVGGSATGVTKSRGGSNYYRQLQARSAAAKRKKGKAKK